MVPSDERNEGARGCWQLRERHLLAIVMLVAIGVHGWLFTASRVTSRDGIAFATVARQLDDPNEDRKPDAPTRSRMDVVRASPHPPGYPLAIWAVSVPVRMATSLPAADSWILSARLAAFMAAVVLAGLHYRLTRELFSPGIACLGACLLQILPVAARVTSDALSEGLFLVAVSSALIAGARSVRAGGWPWSIACGFGAASAYLIRPEGVLTALAVAGVLAALGISSRIPLRVMAVRWAGLAFGFLVVASPYMYGVGGITNKPTGKDLLRRLIDSSPAPETSGAALGPVLFGAWKVPGTGGNSAMWLASTLGSELARSFTIAGLFALLALARDPRWYRKTDSGERVPVVYAVLHLVLIAAMASVSGYLSERHTLPIVFVLCGFAASGMVAAAGYLARIPRVPISIASVAIAVGMTAFCLPTALRPRHDDRLGHVQAGRWLADHSAPGDGVVDPFGWAEFYADRHTNGKSFTGTEYAILELGNAHIPNSKLPKLEHARELAQIGTPVFCWPENAGDGKRVVVYRIKRAGHE